MTPLVYSNSDSSEDRDTGSREIGAFGITSTLHASLERHLWLELGIFVRGMVSYVAGTAAVDHSRAILFFVK